MIQNLSFVTNANNLSGSTDRVPLYLHLLSGLWVNIWPTKTRSVHLCFLWANIRWRRHVFYQTEKKESKTSSSSVRRTEPILAAQNTSIDLEELKETLVLNVLFRACVHLVLCSSTQRPAGPVGAGSSLAGQDEARLAENSLKPVARWCSPDRPWQRYRQTAVKALSRLLVNVILSLRCDMLHLMSGWALRGPSSSPPFRITSPKSFLIRSAYRNAFALHQTVSTPTKSIVMKRRHCLLPMILAWSLSEVQVWVETWLTPVSSHWNMKTWGTRLPRSCTVRISREL